MNSKEKYLKLRSARFGKEVYKKHLKNSHQKLNKKAENTVEFLFHLKTFDQLLKF